MEADVGVAGWGVEVGVGVAGKDIESDVGGRWYKGLAGRGGRGALHYDVASKQVL